MSRGAAALRPAFLSLVRGGVGPRRAYRRRARGDHWRRALVQRATWLVSLARMERLIFVTQLIDPDDPVIGIRRPAGAQPCRPRRRARHRQRGALGARRPRCRSDHAREGTRAPQECARASLRLGDRERASPKAPVGDPRPHVPDLSQPGGAARADVPRAHHALVRPPGQHHDSARRRAPLRCRRDGASRLVPAARPQGRSRSATPSTPMRSRGRHCGHGSRARCGCSRSAARRRSRATT